MAFTIGKSVPDFQVEYWQRGAAGAKELSLSDYSGQWLVLFFYIRDFSYICPTELQAFANLSEDFARKDAAVIAASTDS